jgi:hypothetical protein
MKMMKNIALDIAQTKSLMLVGMLVLCGGLLGCKQPQNQSLLSSPPPTDTAANALAAVPFAYDLAVDTISYNSCVGSELNSSGLFGLKMGVNEGFVDTNGSGAVKGGLKLRSDFLQYVVKNITPNFPATAISTSQIQYLLKNSKANQNLYIQYGVRNSATLKLVPDLIQGGPVKQDRDGIYETSPLSDDPLLTNITKSVTFGSGTVLSEGPRVYNASTASAPKAFEATFGYSNYTDSTFPVVQGADDSLGAGEEYADRVRTKFSAGTYILAQTYGNPLASATADSVSGLDTPQRATATSADQTKAYGRAFYLNFTTRNASLGSWRKNILNRVTEKNLEDGRQTSGVSWTCDYAVIMKSGQLNSKKSSEPACSQLLASDLQDAVIAARVKNFRRQYAEADWAIGIYYPKNTIYNPATRLSGTPKLCLVSKSVDCYLPTVGLIASAPNEDIGIQYDESQECYLSRYVPMGVTYSGGKTGNAARRIGRCPQYASVCVRSSTSY